MRRSVSITMIVAAILFVASGIVPTEYLQAQTDANDELVCSQCHACEKPSMHDTCLKPCYRHMVRSQASDHSLSEAPDSVWLDELAAEHLPIMFDHKPHARMAGMKGDCAGCHHYSPKGKIPACRTCHPKDASTANYAQPDLKTAYHQQCLGCHSQWANEALCDVCHPQPANGNAPKSQLTMGGSVLPTVDVPVSKTYKTTLRSAPFVTFQHIEHIELFEFECVDCHQHENCQYCHDQVNREYKNKPMNQIHRICSECHEIGDGLTRNEGCDKCHDLEQRPGKFHSVVGRRLPEYLQHVGCTGCHESRGSMGQ